jgi:hypothetical protein
MNKILPIILLFLIGFVSYAVYTQANKSAKIKRIDCQSKTTTFEKIFVEEPIKEAINSLRANNYIINSSINYSKYMKSNLINILTKEQADKKLESAIKKYVKSENNQTSNDKKVSIDYYIYENDKEDVGKKNNDAKKYAGYLMFDFKYDNILVYKIQTDYMDINGLDIEDRMNCVINSFISID